MGAQQDAGLNGLARQRQAPLFVRASSGGTVAGWVLTRVTRRCGSRQLLTGGCGVRVEG